jgi:beta-galactosidase
MYLGVDYYPEQWSEERWAIDARLMREAGLSVVRIGEFAWAKMEPNEGVFDWEWLDRAIEILAGEELYVILCTPTAAPPAWLSYTYPDTLPVNAQGQRFHTGSRRHYCVNSTIFRSATQRIVNAMAQRYGQHPAIIGWQLDNEFGCHNTTRCYCENCRTAFRNWLVKRYGSLDNLNAAWGTIFWSQTYTDWAQIDLPNLTVAIPNPSHVLDYDRFASDSYLAYEQLQIDLLRSTIQSFQWVTTNVMLDMFDIDYHALAKPLTFVSWDSYPTGHRERVAPHLYLPGETPVQFAYDLGDPLVTGFGHDLVRGLKQAPFWIMEQQPGQINWADYNPGLRPGAPRLWVWHAAASGADAVVFFRWRAGIFAQEQFHAGLLHHDSSPDLGYHEVVALDSELANLQSFTQSPYQAQAALLMTYPDLWALELQPHNQLFSLQRHLFVYYRAFQRLGIQVDIVSPDASLGGYRLLVAPTLFLSDELQAHTLDLYVQQGGTLLMGVRSGFKTLSNQVTDQPLPGVFRHLVGAMVTDWHSLPPGVTYDLQTDIPGLGGAASLWAETLYPDLLAQPWEGIAAALASYTSGPFAGRPALTERLVGDGRVLYMGWFPSLDQAQALLAYLAGKTGIERIGEIPDGMVAIRRGEKTALFNFTEEDLALLIQGQAVGVPARDLLIY